MTVIRIAQNQCCSNGRTREGRANDFLTRAAAFIQSTLQVEVKHDDIVVLFQRGEAYQLESEKDFVRYMLIAIAAGSGAAMPDPTGSAMSCLDPRQQTS